LGWAIESISPSHVAKAFKSNHHSLDFWLQRHALQNEQNGIARTRVLIRGDSPTILGFYSLAATTIQIDELPPEIRQRLAIRYPAPAILLGQLAIHRELHRQGLGGLLMAHALRTARQASELVGAIAVAVDAIDNPAVDFYRHYGFSPLKRDGRHLFLPMSGIPTN
jgi:GNAT superfamily N-acetyltransferase